MVKPEHIIEKVIIDVKKKQVTICDNGKDIPEQVITFTDEDEWNTANDREGNSAVDVNIWWDEQWGFQFVDLVEDERDGNLSIGSDYRNPDTIEFVDDDRTPFHEGEPIVKYPEHEKLMKVKKESQSLGEFLEYLGEKGIELAIWGDPHGNGSVGLVPLRKSKQTILADYFGIDQDILEDEKRQMIEALQKMNN